VIRRILVPLNQTLLSRSAVPLASSLALASGAQVVLLTIVSEATPFDPLIGIDTEDTRNVSERYLSQIEDELHQQGIDAQQVILQGDPAAFIVMFAATQGVDLIVMATHARGGVDRWSLGSVADEVMRKSPVPVMLTRADSETKRTDTLLPKRILVPLDGSTKSEWIMPIVVAVADIAQSEIVLLHVLPQHESDALMPAVHDNATDPAYDIVATTWGTRHAVDYLEAVARRYGIPDRPGTALVRVGEPPAHILGTAVQEAVDLIAITTHGRSGVRRFALGSVATRIVQESRLPLLTISVGAIEVWEDRGATGKTN